MFQRNPNYNIRIPGREIPKWFEHQSEGTSVNLQVPSDKLKGIALCAVSVLRQHHPRHQLLSDDRLAKEYKFTHCVGWYLKANGDKSRRRNYQYVFSEQFAKIESYHLHLDYTVEFLSSSEIQKKLDSRC